MIFEKGFGIQRETSLGPESYPWHVCSITHTIVLLISCLSLGSDILINNEISELIQFTMKLKKTLSVLLDQNVGIP